MGCQELFRVKREDFGDGVGVVIKTFIEVGQLDAKHGAGEHHGINFVPKRFPEVWFDIIPVEHLIAVERNPRIQPTCCSRLERIFEIVVRFCLCPIQSSDSLVDARYKKFQRHSVFCRLAIEYGYISDIVVDTLLDPVKWYSWFVTHCNASSPYLRFP